MLTETTSPSQNVGISVTLTWTQRDCLKVVESHGGSWRKPLTGYWQMISCLCNTAHIHLHVFVLLILPVVWLGLKMQIRWVELADFLSNAGMQGKGHTTDCFSVALLTWLTFLRLYKPALCVNTKCKWSQSIKVKWNHNHRGERRIELADWTLGVNTRTSYWCLHFYFADKDPQAIAALVFFDRSLQDWSGWLLWWLLFMSGDLTTTASFTCLLVIHTHAHTHISQVTLLFINASKPFGGSWWSDGGAQRHLWRKNC